MIVIKIERKVTTCETVKKNLLKTRTPTDIKRTKSYGNATEEEIGYRDEYEVVNVTEKENRTITLLEQEIEDETKFDFGVVMAAINQLVAVDIAGARAKLDAALYVAQRTEKP